MSHYLAERIKARPDIEVLTNTEVLALNGSDGNLESIRWRNNITGEQAEQAVRHLFLFIGADPNTNWLVPCGVRLDEKGFVHTGAATGRGLKALETNLDGVFAIGDVRSGSVKRVAAAVGEGAQVVAAIHAHLARSAGRPNILGPVGVGL
jgi:thioredoxin reductase (NADPH)